VSPRPPVSPSHRPLVPPLLPVFLAESMWIYLALRILLAVSNPEMAFTPAVVLAPYGLSALTTLLITRSSAPIAPLRAALFTTLDLFVGLACLLSLVWWELYPEWAPLDPGWLALAVNAARGGGTVSPAVWLVAFGVLLWWRGSHLVQEENDFPSLVARFFWGTTALLVLAAMGATTPLGPALASWLLAGYLLFGMAAVAASRLQSTQEGRAGGVDFGWQWWAWILTLAVLMAGFILSFLLLPRLGELARWLRDWLANVLLPALLEALAWIAHLLGLDQPPKPVPAPPAGGGVPGGEPTPLLTLPERIRDVIRRLFDLTWITLILYAFYAWVRRWRWGRRRAEGAADRRERLPWAFKLDLRRILTRLLGALLARWPYLSRWIVESYPGVEQSRTVRHLYRKLLAWGRERGQGRAPWVTPREYQRLLAARWPDLEAPFDTLTESYLRVRYGGIAPSEQELSAATAGWQRVHEWVDSRRTKDVE